MNIYKSHAQAYRALGSYAFREIDGVVTHVIYSFNGSEEQPKAGFLVCKRAHFPDQEYAAAETWEDQELIHDSFESETFTLESMQFMDLGEWCSL